MSESRMRRFLDYLLLLLALAVAGYAVWNLRQPSGGVLGGTALWWILILAGVAGGIALRRMEVEPRPTIVGAVLAEGWSLVTALGYEPQIEGCVQCGRVLGASEVARFDLSAGGLRCSDCATDDSGPRVGPGARRQLSDLLRATVPEDLGKPRAHLRLLHDFVIYHVSGSKPLKTFRVFSSVAGLEE